MDENLNQLEDRAASNAIRYGRIVAIVAGAAAVAGAGFLIYRRMHRPTLKEQLPSVTVRVIEKRPQERGTIESIVRKVAPALVGTASTALLGRVARPRR